MKIILVIWFFLTILIYFLLIAQMVITEKKKETRNIKIYYLFLICLELFFFFGAASLFKGLTLNDLYLTKITDFIFRGSREKIFNMIYPFFFSIELSNLYSIVYFEILYTFEYSKLFSKKKCKPQSIIYFFFYPVIMGVIFLFVDGIYQELLVFMMILFVVANIFCLIKITKNDFICDKISTSKNIFLILHLLYFFIVGLRLLSFEIRCHFIRSYTVNYFWYMFQLLSNLSKVVQYFEISQLPEEKNTELIESRRPSSEYQRAEVRSNHEEDSKKVETVGVLDSKTSVDQTFEDENLN